MSNRIIVRIIVSIIIITIIGIGIKIGIANAQVHTHADLHRSAKSHESETRGESLALHGNHLRSVAVHDHQLVQLDVHPMSVHSA